MGDTQLRDMKLEVVVIPVSDVDIQAARADLIECGAKVSEIYHRTGPGKPAINGVHPQRGTYSSFATFSDPDGNSWLLQEITTRLPGRVDAAATFTSPT